MRALTGAVCRTVPRARRTSSSTSGPLSARSASACAARSVRRALRVSERSTRPAVVYVAAKAQPASSA